MDKVSVIIPSYNHEKFIGDAIESVLNQSYPHIEIIVVDDGSTDGTQEILSRFQSQINIMFMFQENSGGSAARNSGIRVAQGRYICFLDSDDVFHPEKVERQIEFFNTNPEIGLVHTGAYVLLKANEGWKHWYTYTPPVFHSRDEQIKELLKANYIACSTVMVRRDLFSQVGLFNTKYDYAPDYDMWLRLLTCSDFSSIPEALIHYRWHGGNQSRNLNHDAVSVIQQEAAERFGYNR